jgi:hypothetical protein
MEIGKLDIKPLVLVRLKQNSKMCFKLDFKLGFKLDRAISEEKYILKDGNGWIYRLSSSECEQKYIGLTKYCPERRFKQHKNSARKGSNKLIDKTIRRYGVETFFLEIVESQVPFSELSEREIHYINDFNTRAPHDLNTSAGGQLGGCRGKPIKINGKGYKSITEAGKDIEKKTNGAVRWFTVERRIRNREDIYANTRKNSTHADAGSNLFRRYLGLINTKQLCRRWLDYDLFKLDVLKEFTMTQIIDQKLRLGKIKDPRLYSQSNFVWVTPKEAIEARCGKPINAFGQIFPSMTACSVYFDMPVSTLKYRIRVLKFTPEQAVTTI